MENKASFTELLLGWFYENCRDFPWRHKTNPYEILIAEIMLQRTRAEQVVPVYIEFLQEFPSIEDLNAATIEQVRRYFERLGLLWRASLVKNMAYQISTNFQGRIPDNRKDLLCVHAIGEYIADAVLAFAYGKSVAVIDSNVVRVIGRVFGLKITKEARRNPLFRKVVNGFVPRDKAREFNWAIIDHASLICCPKKPLCQICPLNKICEYAKSKGLQVL